MTFSFEQLVIDNEIVRMVQRAISGIEVNEETLAVDLIEKVGPAGTFLGERHTVNHMRAGDEQSIAHLFDRTMRATWDAAGQPAINDVANQKVREILENHVPKPLDKDVQDELDAIVAEGRK